MAATIFETMYPNSAKADSTTTASTTTASKRCGIGAGFNGISNPGRLSLTVSTAGSIRIPPSAGGGGASSGASKIRGRSSTGSASSSNGDGGTAQERGKVMIFAVVSAASGEIAAA